MQNFSELDVALAKLKHMLDRSERIVFFGGAGVSTESGIPDFRSVDGLYQTKYSYPPETILSHSFFQTYPEEFYRFYRDKMLFLSARPNAAHLALARLEQQGKLSAIVTQNIDGLHQAAGNKKVLELHGSVLRNYCTACHKFFPVEAIVESEGLPLCDKCHSLIKPDVVLYEEGLNPEVLQQATDAISQADMLIVGGTSLVVYPAAGLLRYYKGNRLVLINKSITSLDGQAQLVINESIGKVLSSVI